MPGIPMERPGKRQRESGRSPEHIRPAGNGGFLVSKRFALITLILFASFLVSPRFGPAWGSPLTLVLPKIDRRPSPGLRQAGHLDQYPEDGILLSKDLSSLDLREPFDLVAHMSAFDVNTVWPSADHMPQGFDPARALKLGKDPGLGMRALHAQGIDGRGVGIGVIDHPLLTEHIEYADRVRLYEEVNYPSPYPARLHGAAVASLACGKTVGAAPAANLFFVACRFEDEDQPLDFSYLAKAVRRLVEINRQLPEGEKIRVIAIARGWMQGEPGFDDITAAVREAGEAGVFVVSSSLEETHGFLFHGLGRPPMADPNSWESYRPGSWWAKKYYERGGIRGRYLMAPMDSRTMASFYGPNEYLFTTEAGWSWTIPYLAGVYALAAQVKPEITPQEFWRVGLATGRSVRFERNGEPFSLNVVIDPGALIAALKNE